MKFEVNLKDWPLDFRGAYITRDHALPLLIVLLVTCVPGRFLIYVNKGHWNGEVQNWA